MQSDRPGQDLQALTRAAPSWAAAFAHAPIQEVLPCIARLIKPPLGSQAVAQLFAPHLLAALGRAILSEDKSLINVGMPLLVELCSALRPQGGSVQQAHLPVILTAANQQGLTMAGFIQSLIRSWPNQPAGNKSQAAATHSTDVACTWAAVQCLPHADSNPQHRIRLLEGLITATDDALQESTQPPAAATSSNAKEVLFLQSYARGTLASMLAAHAPQSLQQQADSALQLLYKHRQDFHVVRCTAEVVSLAKKAGAQISCSRLQVHMLHDLCKLHAPGLHSTGLMIVLARDIVRHHLVVASSVGSSAALCSPDSWQSCRRWSVSIQVSCPLCKLLQVAVIFVLNVFNRH